MQNLFNNLPTGGWGRGFVSPQESQRLEAHCVPFGSEPHGRRRPQPSAGLPEELIEVLAENKHVLIERIVSTGHVSPDGYWYDQKEHEWIVVLKGEARLLFEDNDEPIHMKPGDHITIPAHRKHRVDWTTPDEPTVWLAVFYSGE